VRRGQAVRADENGSGARRKEWEVKDKVVLKDGYAYAAWY